MIGGGLLIILCFLELYKILVKILRFVNFDKINILGIYKKIYFCEYNKMGCICIFRNVRSIRWMSEICMKNIKKICWKYDFGVSDFLMMMWMDFVIYILYLIFFIIFIIMVICIFLLLEVFVFEIKVKVFLVVLVFLMKK